MMTIREWLANPTDFKVGLELFDQHGTNGHLKKQFSNGKLHGKLIYELSKLAGVDIANVKITTPAKVVVQIEEKEEVDYMIIKPLYDERTILHNQLSEIARDEKRLQLAERIEELTDQIESILYPVVESKKEKVFKTITDRAQIKERITNLRSYISKHKKNKKREEDVKCWIEEKEILEKQLL